ncbi:probable LRR receptor-like serine/threonine-protein kinase At3g47570 [Coffea eugenioides]|uniref:probable LRR receptor-like serine/threonine-protein kinase At3g47570 n=1 Tax=Coffea eugenioides TaxID=49369 RepID=UPI000F613357|nr:probable LRR receptor-like serine/threonine-protein kinase At3g47570 [Coffea eugenioides]
MVESQLKLLGVLGAWRLLLGVGVLFALWHWRRAFASDEALGLHLICSNPEFKALVLEFMPNGSLEKLLYSHNYFLDLMQRLDILIDVACALQYLHYEYSTPVNHCDLKPSNVLLDQDMVAHLSDFGLTKLLGEENSITYTETLATLGYLAPKYGLEGLVSTKCDTYSFGIMMMEVFTRTKPNGEMFGENLSFKSWVIDSLPDGLAHVIDANLLKESDESGPGLHDGISKTEKQHTRCSCCTEKDQASVHKCPPFKDVLKPSILARTIAALSANASTTFASLHTFEGHAHEPIRLGEISTS